MEKDSENEEMGIDWLWPSQMSTSATPSQPLPKVKNTGILMPEVPEFVPQIQPLEDPQYFLPARDPEDIHSSIVEEGGPVVEEEGSDVLEEEMDVQEERASEPATPEPRAERVKS